MINIVNNVNEYNLTYNSNPFNCKIMDTTLISASVLAPGMFGYIGTSESLMGVKTLSGDLSKVEEIYTGAFATHYFLEDVSFPNCVYIGGGAFYGAGQMAINSNNEIISKTIKIELPNVQILEESALANAFIESIKLPKVTALGRDVLSTCNYLSYVSVPKVSYIATTAFSQCDNLTELYLLSDSLVSIGSGAFRDCPSVHIYVPEGLVENYKNTYSSMSNKFYAYQG